MCPNFVGARRQAPIAHTPEGEGKKKTAPGLAGAVVSYRAKESSQPNLDRATIRPNEDVLASCRDSRGSWVASGVSARLSYRDLGRSNVRWHL